MRVSTLPVPARPGAPVRRPALRRAGVALLALALWGCEAGLLQPTGVSTERSGAGGGAELAPQTGEEGLAGAGNAALPTPADGNGTGMPGAGNDISASRGPGIAMYWGTGNYQGKDPNFATVCATSQYDIVIMSFAWSIGAQTRNPDGSPELQISGCRGALSPSTPYLADCTAVGALIPTCQQAGKKVLLSLGGGGAKVGFASDAEARAYAKLIWDMALGGSGRARPFGAAVLDGIDLDIEGGNAAGYGAFVLELRALMDADKSKPYLITAAPQCVYPDAWMGPGPGTALTLAPDAFDHLFVQFYNNDCRFANASYFAKTWAQWTALRRGTRPMVWVGLPVTTNAAMTPDWLSPTQLTALLQTVGADPAYGGIMMWDAGYDLIDTTAGGAAPYSASVATAQRAFWAMQTRPAAATPATQ